MEIFQQKPKVNSPKKPDKFRSFVHSGPISPGILNKRITSTTKLNCESNAPTLNFKRTSKNDIPDLFINSEKIGEFPKKIETEIDIDLEREEYSEEKENYVRTKIKSEYEASISNLPSQSTLPQEYSLRKSLKARTLSMRDEIGEFSNHQLQQLSSPNKESNKNLSQLVKMLSPYGNPSFISKQYKEIITKRNIIKIKGLNNTIQGNYIKRQSTQIPINQNNVKI